MENWMNRIQEYDKKMGVPQFEGWEEREIEISKQIKTKNLISRINVFLKRIEDWFRLKCPECRVNLSKTVDKYSNVVLTCSKCTYKKEYNDSYP